MPNYFNKENNLLIKAITILLFTSFLSGCLGDNSDEKNSIVGVWYIDDMKNGISFTVDNRWIALTNGLPDNSSYNPDFQTTWSVNEDILTFSVSTKIFEGEYTCENGDTIPALFINDGDADCLGGEDERLDTTDLDNNYTKFDYYWKFKFSKNRDVLFVGLIETAYTMGSTTTSSTVEEENICTESDDWTINTGCEALVLSSAMTGVLHETIVTSTTSPDWWLETETGVFQEEFGYND